MKCKEKLEDEDSIPSEDDTQGPLEELKDTDLYLQGMKNQRVHDEQDNADPNVYTEGGGGEGPEKLMRG